MSNQSLSTSNIKERLSSMGVSFPYEPEETHKITSLSQKLDNFKKFVEFYSIQAQYIWEGKHSLLVDEFIKILDQKMGYKFKSDQIASLHKMGTNLERLDFWELGIWQRRNDKKQTNISKSVNHKFFLTKQESHLREQQIPSLISQANNKSRCKKQPCDQITSNFLKNGYISQLSMDGKLQSLRTDMQMNSLEKKWQFIVMAGQMNRWIEEECKVKHVPWIENQNSQSNKTNINFKRPEFRVMDHETCDFRIIRKQGQKEELVPQIVFVKRYRAMKKKQATKKEAGKDINKAIFQLVELKTSPKGTLSSKCSQRDRQLNQTLLHIMRIRNTLQHQYRILAESAINT